MLIWQAESYHDEMTILQKTSVHCALERRILATRAPYFIASSLISCARYFLIFVQTFKHILKSWLSLKLHNMSFLSQIRVGTSPKVMVLEANPSMGRSLLMKTLPWNILDLAYCPWLMLGPTPMDHSSSSAQRKLPGELGLEEILQKH